MSADNDLTQIDSGHQLNDANNRIDQARTNLNDNLRNIFCFSGMTVDVESPEETKSDQNGDKKEDLAATQTEESPPRKKVKCEADLEDEKYA